MGSWRGVGYYYDGYNNVHFSCSCDDDASLYKAHTQYTKPYFYSSNHHLTFTFFTTKIPSVYMYVSLCI